VARVSAGTALAQSAYAHAQRTVRELMTDGTYAALEETIDYFAFDAAMARPGGA